jgi:hypothetical protein
MKTNIQGSVSYIDHDEYDKTSAWFHFGERLSISRLTVNYWYCTVGIALGYGLDDRGSRVRFLAGAGNFSLHHCLQNGSGAHPASYLIGTRGSFPGGKAAGV